MKNRYLVLYKNPNHDIVSSYHSSKSEAKGKYDALQEVKDISHIAVIDTKTKKVLFC